MFKRYIDNLVIVKKPNVKLYFDLNYSNVSLDIKFDYKNNIVSYFDKNNSNILDCFYLFSYFVCCYLVLDLSVKLKKGDNNV